MTRRLNRVKTPIQALPVLAMTGLLALSLAACGDEDSPASATEPDVVTLDDLDGRAFVAESIDAPGVELVTGTQVRLAFQGDEISAHAGCNHLLGSVEVDDDELVTSAMAATEIGCEQELADQDAWLQEFLASRLRLELGDDTLTLLSDATTVALTEAPAPDPTDGGDPDEPTGDVVE